MKGYDDRKASRVKTGLIRTQVIPTRQAAAELLHKYIETYQNDESPRIPIYFPILTKPLPNSTPIGGGHKHGRIIGRKKWTTLHPKQKSGQKAEYKLLQHQTCFLDAPSHDDTKLRQ